MAPCARSFVAAGLAIGTVVSLAEADPPIPERRSTTCDVCEEEAASFNIEISRREREAATVPDASQFRAKIARLGRELDACEATECPPIVAFPDVTPAAKTSEPRSNPIGAEFGVSARIGPFSGMTDPAFPGDGYGAHAGVRLYGVYLGAAISSFPSANFCFWFPCSQPFRMVGGVVGYDFEPTRVLVLRTHLDLGDGRFFPDYDCTASPGCVSRPHALYVGGGLSLLVVPPLALPPPWRPFVGVDVTVLTIDFNGMEPDKGQTPRIPLEPASRRYGFPVFSFDVGIRL